ncbi:MAG TPA: hypothetical protein VI733_03620 [Candidatus Limnocylindria bacterium]|nr:hypothetical protein [Candidatus Limnocylindria bacterium]
MTGSTRSSAPAVPPRTLVWVDAARAIIVRWDGAAGIEWLVSEVPARRRGGGHVTHDSALRAMGSRPANGHRLEHLRQHLRQVADRIDPRDDLEVIGPGTVRERLAALVVEDDRVHRRRREVRTNPSPPLSEPQLVARIRATAGASAPRGRREGAGAA